MKLSQGALGLAFLLWMAVVWLPGSEQTARGQATVLAAASIGHDLDLRLEAKDAARAGQQGLEGPLWIRRLPPKGVVPLNASLLLALLGAPVSWLFSGPSLGIALRFLELLLVGVAVSRSVVALSPRLGAVAPLWLGALLFGSSAWLYARLGTGDLTQFALAMWVAAVLVPTAPSGPADIYEGDFGAEQEELPATHGPPGLWQVGIPLGFLLFEEWVLFFLLLPIFAVTRDRGAQRWRLAIASAATLVALAGVWTLLSGAAPWSGTVAWLSEVERVPIVTTASSANELGAVGRDLAERRSASLDPATLAHAAVQMVAGPRTGLVLGCVPLLVLFSLGLARQHRTAVMGWSLVSVLSGAAALLFLRTYDLGGGPDAIGNRLMLPAVALVGVLAVPRVPMALALLTIALGQLALWPAQAESWGRSELAGRVPSLRSVLPAETTQSLVGASEGVMLPGEVWVRPWSETALRLRGGRWNRISVARSEALDEVVLQLSSGAPGQVEVRGGEVAELMFRPDDSVLVQVNLTPSRKRHLSWWSAQPVYWYDLAVRPQGEGSWGFTLRPGRLR